MPTAEVLFDILTVAALAISVVTDLRTRKILNVVTYPALLLGLLGHLAVWGWSAGAGLGLKWSLIGLFVGGIPFLAFNAMNAKAFGMGDVKLMAAVGALQGFPFILGALIYVALVGGLLALVVLLWKGELLGTLGGLFRRRSSDEDEPEGEGEGEGRPRPAIYVPYGVAIAGGTVWALALELTGRGLIPV